MTKIIKKPIKTKRGTYKTEIIDDDATFRVILYERQRRLGIPFWKRIKGEAIITREDITSIRKILRKLISEHEDEKTDTAKHEGLVDEVRRRLNEWDGKVK